MAVVVFFKDPSAVLDYTLDWSSWLDDTDTISAAAWTVPAGLTNVLETNTTTTTTVWLGSGVLDTTYAVYCRITTLGGRTDDRTITITVVDK
jgi:hypothetical protein